MSLLDAIKPNTHMLVLANALSATIPLVLSLPPEFSLVLLVRFKVVFLMFHPTFLVIFSENYSE